jgi:hypothetical protein
MSYCPVLRRVLHEAFRHELSVDVSSRGGDFHYILNGTIFPEAFPARDKG